MQTKTNIGDVVKAFGELERIFEQQEGEEKAYKILKGIFKEQGFVLEPNYGEWGLTGYDIIDFSGAEAKRCKFIPLLKKKTGFEIARIFFRDLSPNLIFIYGEDEYDRKENVSRIDKLLTGCSRRIKEEIPTRKIPKEISFSCYLWNNAPKKDTSVSCCLWNKVPEKHNKYSLAI